MAVESTWRAAVRRRPVLWFWLVAVAIEIAIVPLFLLSGAQSGLDRALTSSGIDFNTDLVTAARLVLAEPQALLGVLLALGQVAAPDIAVLAVGTIMGGGTLTAVRRRLRFWSPAVGARRGLRLWAAMIALLCALNLATAGLNALTARDKGFEWTVQPLLWPLLIGLVVAMFLDGGAVFEENGWRGFALPLLQRRYGPLVGSLVLGVIWGLWHLPVKFDLFGYGAVGALTLMAVIVAKLTALSVVMTYFVNRAGGATILAIAMHGLSNDSVRLGGVLTEDSFGAYLLSEVNLLLPLTIAAIALVIGTRGRLGSDPLGARTSTESLGVGPPTTRK